MNTDIVKSKYDEISIFINDWITFVQIASEISRKHKKWLDSNEIVGLILIINKYGEDFYWKDLFQILLFLKTVNSEQSISLHEFKAHKVFISRFLKGLVERNHIVLINEGDQRIKRYKILKETQNILCEIKLAFEEKRKNKPNT